MNMYKILLLKTILTFLIPMSIKTAYAQEFLIAKPNSGYGFSEQVMKKSNLNAAEIMAFRQSGYHIEVNQALYLHENESDDPGGIIIAWPFTQTKVDKVHQKMNIKGQGIKVCVIDSGVDQRHPLLKGKVISGKNFIDPQQGLQDDIGHGTLLASLIAGQRQGLISGIAPEAELVIAKVVSAKAGGKLEHLIPAIEFCSDRADVINLSLSIEKPSLLLKVALQKAIAKGKTIIASAGNSPTYMNPLGLEKGVILVGAVDQQQKVSRFSSRNPRVNFYAPGDKMFILNTRGAFQEVAGTSLSAAFVSGIEALRRSAGGKTLRTRTVENSSSESIQLVDALSSLAK